VLSSEERCLAIAVDGRRPSNLGLTFEPNERIEFRLVIAENNKASFSNKNPV